jgi:actin-related protein
MDETPLILDIGSFLTKSGFSHSSDGPRMVTLTILGRIRNLSHSSMCFPMRPVYSGDMALSKSGVLVFPRLFDEGNDTISSWSEFELYLKALFEDLHVTISDQPLVIVVPPTWTKDCYTIARFVIGAHKASNIALINADLATLINTIPPTIPRPHLLTAISSLTGVVVHLGHTLSYIHVFYKGKKIRSENTLPTGRVMDKLLTSTIEDKFNIYSTSTKQTCEISSLKPQIFTLARNPPSIDPQTKTVRFQNVLDTVQPVTYNSDLLDPSQFTFTNEHAFFAEAFFYPSALDEISLSLLEFYPFPSIQSTIIKQIGSCVEETRSELLQNIIITGGLSNVVGFEARLNKELRLVLDSLEETRDVQFHCIQVAGGPWRGGSRLFHKTGAMESLGISYTDYLACDDEQVQDALVEAKKLV